MSEDGLEHMSDEEKQADVNYGFSKKEGENNIDGVDAKKLISEIETDLQKYAEIKKLATKETPKEANWQDIFHEKGYKIINPYPGQQERADKIHGLFELGILPKIDEQTGSKLEDLFVHNELAPSRSETQKFVENYGKMIIDAIDKWSEMKKNNEKAKNGYNSLEELVSDIKDLKDIIMRGDPSGDWPADRKTGLPQKNIRESDQDRYLGLKELGLRRIEPGKKY